MMDRRRFLAHGTLAVGGIVFTGCGVLGAPHASPPQQQGVAPAPPRRARTIDVHAHCVIPEALALMGIDVFTLYPKTMHGGQENVIVIAERLAAMDAQGVDMEVPSINPFWYEQARATSARIVRL